MTSVCVVGCGAIGSLFAAHLARVPGVTVWGYDVSTAHVAAITARGLRVDGADGFTAPVNARTDAGDIPPCDFGVVAVKAEHTEAAMAATAGIFADGAVASVQNGIGNEEVVARFVPRVIRGSTLIAGAITEPGVVRMDASGDTWLGPFEPSPAGQHEVDLLASLLVAGGMGAHGLADARGAQWTKLLFNSATNAVSALTGLTAGPLMGQASSAALIRGLLAEGRAVATALGITLDTDPEDVLDDAVVRAPNHRPSMLQDVAARRHTEIAVLNGGVAAAGLTVGVPTPLNDAVVALVEGLERSWQDAPTH